MGWFLTPNVPEVEVLSLQQSTSLWPRSFICPRPYLPLTQLQSPTTLAFKSLITLATTLFCFYSWLFPDSRKLPELQIDSSDCMFWCGGYTCMKADFSRLLFPSTSNMRSCSELEQQRHFWQIFFQGLRPSRKNALYYRSSTQCGPRDLLNRDYSISFEISNTLTFVCSNFCITWSILIFRNTA